MSDDPSAPPAATVSGKEPWQLRSEVVEILHRRQRGLPGFRQEGSPQPVRPAAERAAAALAEGRTLFAAGNIAEALLRADTVIGLAGAGSDLMVEGLTLNGEGRLLQENPQAARAAFERCLAINPAHIPARMGLAVAYRRLYRPANAIPIYLETLALVSDPQQRAHLKRLIADTYQEAGKPHAARHVLRIGSVKQMAPPDRIRAALALLLPATRAEWVGVALLLAALLYLARRGEGAIALLLFAALLALHGMLRWQRASRR